MSRSVEFTSGAIASAAPQPSLPLPAIDLPDAEAGVAYDFQLPMPTPTGAWSTAAPLPAGLQMTAGGHITGTYTGTVDVPFPKFVFTEPN